jgi:hypothetical protein
MLKPQSIRKGIVITINGKEAEKQEVIDLSKEWSEQQLNFFKKLLKQGGSTKINGVSFTILIQDKIVNSKGEKDPGIITIPGADMRF